MNIPITCICYKQNKQRVKNVYENIKIKCKYVTIFPAIDGNSNELEYYLDKKINHKFLKICRRGQIACLLSHLEVWKNMVDKQIPEMIIIEDDSIISNNFESKLNNVYNELPKNYNFVYLFSHPSTKKTNKIDSYEYKYLDKGYFTYGFVGYLTTLSFAKEMIEIFKDNIYTTVDDTISYYLKNNNKTYFCVKENLIETGGKLFFHHNTPTQLGSIIGETGRYKDTIPCPNFYIETENKLQYPYCKIINNKRIFYNDSEGVIINKCDRNKYETLSSAVLLTGGCGFIGSHTAVELLLSGHELIIVDMLSNSDYNVIEKIKDIVRMEGIKPQIFFYNYDITDINLLENVFYNHPNIESVIHFAAYKAVGESVAEPLKYYQNNLLGLMNILECMKTYNVNNIIFSSSATVYGDPKSLPLKETSQTSTLNPYGRTKLFGEEIIKDLCNVSNIKCIILRYFNPVGAHPSGLIGENPKGVPNNLFPYIISVIQEERQYLQVFGNDYPTKDGSGVRDYIHVVDLAKGHIAALNHIENIQTYDIFNLGTGKGYSVLDILNKFSELLEKEIPYKIVERRAGDSAEVYADCNKAEQILNWKYNLELEDMVRDSINFFLRFHIKN